MTTSCSNAVRSAGGIASPAVDSRDRIAVLLLAPATGGGHRAAAAAIGDALRERRPDRFAPVMCDPLTGSAARPLVRGVSRAYGPLIRRTPWLWGLVYHLTDGGPMVRVLQAALRRFAAEAVRREVARHRPAVIVSLHPLTGCLAAAARDRSGAGPAVMTVVTDLAAPHRMWGAGDVDHMVLPRPAAARFGRAAGGSTAPGDGAAGCGLPVAAAFASGPLAGRERSALRRGRGLDPDLFWVLVTGGGEGAGGLVRRVCAILARLDGVGVVVLCGRNRRAARLLTARAARAGGRLRVLGFVDDVADWLRCADVVVGKAGPGTIAEAACCGVPLLLTGHLPGQERGNTEVVTAAGAGGPARSIRRLVREIDRLRGDPARLAGLRAGAARLASPGAAVAIAARVAELADEFSRRVAGPSDSLTPRRSRGTGADHACA